MSASADERKLGDVLKHPAVLLLGLVAGGGSGGFFASSSSLSKLENSVNAQSAGIAQIRTDIALIQNELQHIKETTSVRDTQIELVVKRIVKSEALK